MIRHPQAPGSAELGWVASSTLNSPPEFFSGPHLASFPSHSGKLFGRSVHRNPLVRPRDALPAQFFFPKISRCTLDGSLIGFPHQPCVTDVTGLRPSYQSTALPALLDVCHRYGTVWFSSLIIVTLLPYFLHTMGALQLLSSPPADVSTWRTLCIS